MVKKNGFNLMMMLLSLICAVGNAFLHNLSAFLGWGVAFLLLLGALLELNNDNGNN